MVKVFTNKALEFSNGTEKHSVGVGFGTAPDWIVETDFYKLALLDGSIKTFDSALDKSMEQILKDDEEKAALKAEIEKLKADNAKLSEPKQGGPYKTDKTDKSTDK
jgi:hypothetical protein